MAGPARLNQSPDYAFRHDQRTESRHHTPEAEERAENSDYASENEQQAESTRKLIQLYSISRPVQERKERKGGGKPWKTGSTRVDNLLHEFNTRKLRALRYRTRTLWLLVLYFPLLVVPWILTCILSQRPVTARSYVNQQGFSKADIISIRNWRRAVDVLSSIAGLITIPLLSALLAQGAVVFSQRQRPEEFLSLPDLFALVDHGWTSIAALWRSLTTKQKEERGQKLKLAWHYLLPGAVLILLGAIQQPLMQILVPMETIYLASCEDVGFMPHCETQYKEQYMHHSASTAYESVGVDIEPAQMAGIYYQDILPRITADLASVSIETYQPSLWSDYMPKGLQSYMNYDHPYDTGSKATPLRIWIFPMSGMWGSRFFLAGIPSNTTTGILREHAMRLNSTVACSKIERTSFPTSCPGEEPFTASSEMTDDISVRICVPGKLGVFPWTLSRNRQDIVEEIYLDMWDNYEYRGYVDGDTNATVHCEVKTTRGYFELGNLKNNGTYGPLLRDWPDADVMARDFNDLVSDDRTAFVPTESDDFVGDSVQAPYSSNIDIPSLSWKASGPLTLSAVALFGNISWFSNVSKYSANMTHDTTTAGEDQSSWYRMCAGMPFSTLSRLYGPSFHAADTCESSLWDQMVFGSTDRDLLKLRYQWLEQFAPTSQNSNDTARLEALLRISAFVTNQALLNHYAPTVDHTLLGGSNFRGRKVYTSPGYPVLKPDVSVAVLSVMTILIGLQLLGLLCLAWYICHMPSWTDSLDAMAVAHIGARLGQQNLLLAGVSGDRERDARALQRVDGLIGVVNVEEGHHDSDTELQQLRRASLEVDRHSR